MEFVLTAATLLSLVGGAAGWGGGGLMHRLLDGRQRLRAFRGMLAATLVPLGWVVQHVARFSARSGSGPAGVEAFGYYPGVWAYIGWGVVMGLLLLAAAWTGARRATGLAAWLPAGLFLSHHLVGPMLLGWRVPGGDAPPIDNVLLVWFFIVSTAEVVALGTVAYRGRIQADQS